jgi:hypothetical protein
MRLDECSPEILELIEAQRQLAVREWKRVHLRSAMIDMSVDRLLIGSIPAAALTQIVEGDAIKKLAQFLVDSGATERIELPDEEMNPRVWESVHRFRTIVTVVKP